MFQKKSQLGYNMNKFKLFLKGQIGLVIGSVLLLFSPLDASMVVGNYILLTLGYLLCLINLK